MKQNQKCKNPPLLSTALALKLGCMLGSAGELEKYWCLGPTSRDFHLIYVRYRIGMGLFARALGDSNVQSVENNWVEQWGLLILCFPDQQHLHNLVIVNNEKSLAHHRPRHQESAFEQAFLVIVMHTLVWEPLFRLESLNVHLKAGPLTFHNNLFSHDGNHVCVCGVDYWFNILSSKRGNSYMCHAKWHNVRNRVAL